MEPPIYYLKDEFIETVRVLTTVIDVKRLQLDRTQGIKCRGELQLLDLKI